MSATTDALHNAIQLEKLHGYYADAAIAMVNAGQREAKDVEAGNLRAGTLGAKRAVQGPAAYEAARRCAELAAQLVDAHARLVVELREWERVR